MCILSDMWQYVWQKCIWLNITKYKLLYAFPVLTCSLYSLSRHPLRGSGDGNTNPYAVSGVIDHQQINIRLAREQDRHWSPEEERTCHTPAYTNLCETSVKIPQWQRTVTLWLTWEPADSCQLLWMLADDHRLELLRYLTQRRCPNSEKFESYTSLHLN